MSDQFAASSDPIFDRFAAVVRDAIGVPVALVSMVQPARQVFPGAVGLPEPYQTTRETPLSHSFCQYVVADRAALVITDARRDPRVATNLAVPDLGVTAYAGYPLHDADGVVIGSLCAIDTVPRDWTDVQLRLLEHLAEICSIELSLRDSQRKLTTSVTLARTLSERARLLLSVSERLSAAVTTTDVAEALHDVAANHLGCNHAGIWQLTGPFHDLRYVQHPERPWAQAEHLAVFAPDAGNPLGAALTSGRSLYFGDQHAQDVEYPAVALARLEENAEARALVPLIVAGRPVGVMALLWPQQRDFTGDDRLTIAALSSYAAQALHRAQLLAERTSIASTLQAALLTELPQPDHLQLAARYRTATAADEVGGDWYDTIVMPSGATHIAVGDVMGHDIDAAAQMGSLRSMLRTLAWATDGSPAEVVSRLDDAARDLGINRLASVVFGRIEQDERARAAGIRVLRWTNAGHPPPILVGPGGRFELLERRPHGRLIGVKPGSARFDNVVDIEVGSTLVLFTDGLVDTRGMDLDAGLERLGKALAKHHDRDLGVMLDAVLDELVGEVVEDDIAILGVRFGAG